MINPELRALFFADPTLEKVRPLIIDELRKAEAQIAQLADGVLMGEAGRNIADTIVTVIAHFHSQLVEAGDSMLLNILYIASGLVRLPIDMEEWRDLKRKLKEVR